VSGERKSFYRFVAFHVPPDGVLRPKRGRASTSPLAHSGMSPAEQKTFFENERRRAIELIEN
jgi:hypothetical protein